MRIVCLGDSNTKGLDPRSFIYEEYEYPWPRLLARYSGMKVINEGEHGIGIYYTEEHFHYLDSILNKEDMVLLMLGTNDVLRERDMSLIEQRLDACVNYLQKFELLLICPVDVNGVSLINVYQKVANKYKKSILNANDWNIEISYDQVHFTQRGHEQFAKHIYEEWILKVLSNMINVII